MKFALTDDQKMLQESVNGYLGTASDLDAVRKAAAGEDGAASAISSGLAELGVGGILISKAHDGLGLGLLDAALVQEALGARVAPAAHLGNAMAAIAISAAGTEAQKAEWLPKLAAGSVHFGIAASEHVGAREAAGVTASDGKLNGKALFALDAEVASHLVVTDRTGALHIVDVRADGTERADMRAVDRTRRFTEVIFSNTAAIHLSGENEPGRAADEMISAGRLLLAADTLGAAQAMLDKAVAYAADRKQFGRAIGSFQAIKHMCAEMAAQIEPARALVWQAAHAFDRGADDAALLVCLAKSHLAEVGTFVARTSTEVHGGMGFTDLVGLHFWFKRIGANRQLLGGPERVREHAARLQGWA
ncbi:MAG: acyl-CoA dehydrogenase family protein [Pacificimonas sp.]